MPATLSATSAGNVSCSIILSVPSRLADPDAAGPALFWVATLPEQAPKVSAPDKTRAAASVHLLFIETFSFLTLVIGGRIPMGPGHRVWPAGPNG